MTGGDICLVMPARPFSLGDKSCLLKRRPLPRCLFGPPDPAETEKLLQEQMQRERERFQRRWNIDLDLLEAAVEKRENMKVATEEVEKELDERIPPMAMSKEVEERLSSAGVAKEVRPSRSSSHVPFQRKTAVCAKKPCSKFQKRVRVAGHHKRQTQTHLTDFWRSRRSVAFVFSKSKTRAVSFQTAAPAPALD